VRLEGAAEAANRLGDLVVGAQVRADADDVRAGRREGFGHGAADATAGAGDDREPSAEVEQRGHARPAPATSTRIFIARPAARSCMAVAV
jgi:hypothetical protein